MYVQELLIYTENNLSTECLARYVLESSGHASAKRVLYLSQQLFPDYLRCVTLLGFKDLLGANAHDYIKVTHLYKDYDGSRVLYGKGFSYSSILDPATHNSMYDDTILEDIRNKVYDVIVYGSCYRGMPLYKFISLFYDPKDFVFLCGEDEQTRDPHIDLNLPEESHVYIREML